jgi:nicotinate-nucleotide pyrophosphorylase (carboxylating)
MELTKETETLLQIAVSEDVGPGDLTSQILLSPDVVGGGRIIAREPLVLCGQELIPPLIRLVCPSLQYRPSAADGASLQENDEIGVIRGKLASLLSAERVVLNFLQRLSGVATTTARIVSKVKHLPVSVLDTRKTTPGWRQLEKYAVKTGGGENHRVGLYDAVLIKNNHIDACQGDVARTVRQCREKAPHGVCIEVEVRTQSELDQALTAHPDIILLDNMTPPELKRAVEYVRASHHTVLLEASGGIREENIVQFAQTGVDRISLGALTHSAKAVDISLRYIA